MKCENKYAPKNLDDVIYPSDADKIRIQAYANGELEGHLLLHGPNGTSKSTIARLLIDAIGGSDAHVEVVTSSQFFKNKDLEADLKQKAHLASLTSCCNKYFLLCDEFDAIQACESAFWSALDACGSSVMAIMTTNNIMKVHKSIRSRCDMIEFPAITPMAALAAVQNALTQEGIVLPNQQVLAYLQTRAHTGDLRKYMRVADELILLKKIGQPFPALNPFKPSLKVTHPVNSNKS